MAEDFDPKTPVRIILRPETAELSAAGQREQMLAYDVATVSDALALITHTPGHVLHRLYDLRTGEDMTAGLETKDADDAVKDSQGYI